MARTFGVSPNISAASVVIAQNAALSEAIDMRYAIGGFVETPSTWTAANIGFQICDTVGGTYTIACDETGAPIQVSGVATGKAKSYILPTKLFSGHFVKIWSKDLTAATETDNNQAGARTLKVMLK